MLVKEELEVIIKDAFRDKFVSVRQVNKSTIRIKLVRGFIDIFQSLRDSSKFALHAKFRDGRIYRLDCRPEKKYKKIKTFPWHLHKEKEGKIVASPFSAKKELSVREFVKFINDKIG